MAQKKAAKDAPNIRPLGDRVLVKPTPKEEDATTSSGLIIPKSGEREEVEHAEVVAVGPGRRDEQGERLPMDVSEGDTILFTKFNAEQVTFNNEEYYLVSEDRILAVVE